MRAFVKLGFAMCLAACSSGTSAVTDAGPGGPTCDPLVPDPISIGTVIGVGKDADGKLFVDSSTGIFISDHGPLVRQEVTGSGESGSNEFLFGFRAADGSGVGSLLVETDGTTAKRMALGQPGSRAFLDESPPGTTPLTVVDPGTVDGLRVLNVPFVTSYVADVEGGDVLLVTQSLIVDPSSPTREQRLFFGPASAMQQREVLSFSQSRSGTASLTFKLDGQTASYNTVFEVPTDGGAGQQAIANFSDGHATRTAVVRGSTALSGLAPICF